MKSSNNRSTVSKDGEMAPGARTGRPRSFAERVRRRERRLAASVTPASVSRPCMPSVVKMWWESEMASYEAPVK